MAGKSNKVTPAQQRTLLLHAMQDLKGQVVEVKSQVHAVRSDIAGLKARQEEAHSIFAKDLMAMRSWMPRESQNESAMPGSPEHMRRRAEEAAYANRHTAGGFHDSARHEGPGCAEFPAPPGWRILASMDFPQPKQREQREPRAAVQPGITATNEDLTVSLVAAWNRIGELLARQGRLEEWLQKQGSALKRAEATIEVLSKWRNYVITKQPL